MAEPLDVGLARVRAALLDDTGLVRGVAAGRRRSATPPWRRIELRYVDLKAGRHLQVTSYDEQQAFTRNHPLDEVAAALDELLELPFGNWHVESATESLQLRVTKKGEAMVHAKRVAAETPPEVAREHDRRKDRLLAEDDPLLRVLGLADERGRVKPSRQAKYRQVEEFVRALGASVDDALAAGALRPPTEDDPWQLVDLGCGNAYLTFAAHRYLAGVRGLPVRVVGIDVKEQSREHNSEVARTLGIEDQARFLVASIEDSETAAPDLHPDIVLALHACDTATDDALAAAVRWAAPLVLAAPCCHHEISAQLRGRSAPEPYGALVRDGILRERFADTLTDALRASVLRAHGYRVEVMEFVESRHTPRNTLLRAVATGGAAGPEANRQADQELASLVAAWDVRPRLRELLG